MSQHIPRLHRKVQHLVLVGEDDGREVGSGGVELGCGLIARYWNAWQGHPLNPATDPLCEKCFSGDQKPEPYKAVWRKVY